MGLSMRAYAAHRGVSDTAVRRAVQSGRIRKGEDGLIDPDQADRDWDENTDPSKPESTVGAAATDSSNARYMIARAEREGWNARRAGLDVRLREGELVEADLVRRVTFEAARTARDRLLAIPDRVSAMLAGCQDVDECHRILAREIKAVCSELSKSPLPAAPTPESDEEV